MTIFQPHGLKGKNTDITTNGIKDSQHSKGDLQWSAEIFVLG